MSCLKGTITFTKEALEKYKAECKKAKDAGNRIFIWKNNINFVGDAESLIKRLEASPNLSVKMLW